MSVGTSVARAQNEHLVLAFYYAWFDKNTWTSRQLSDQPVQPYDSRDRATIERHVAQAKSAGIDAFVQSWYGPSGGVNNMTEANFATLLDVSAQSGFRAAVDLETSGPFFGSAGDVQAALFTLLSGHAKHPAYLKIDGKPVVFFWRQQRFSVDTWVTIRNQVDPNHASIWIAEGTDPSYLRVFDGIHFYSVAWSADPAAALVNYAARVRKTAQDLGGFRYWVAPVMPGYDDTRLRGADGFARPRDNGNYYRATFAGASKSGADWLIVTSFNEWLESTEIEPSVTYGDTYLNLTRELVAAYRAGTMSAPVLPLASFTATPSMTLTRDGAALSSAKSAPVTLAVLPTATASPTQTPTPTVTPTVTPTMTPTPAPTETSTVTPAPTVTYAPTQTPVPPTTGPDETPNKVWLVVGACALVLGAVLGGVSARRHGRNAQPPADLSDRRRN